jgi:membrane protease YdiL (CAAX protease family)
MAPSISPKMMSGLCWSGRCRDGPKNVPPFESRLMDSLDPASSAALAAEMPVQRSPRIWKFWGTALWGLFIFAALFVGQIAVVAWFLLRREGPIDLAAAIHVVGGGLTISLSVIMGLPAVLAALWFAIRSSRTPFADYLALRGTSWINFLIGAVALGVLITGWDLLARATGREVAPGFMEEVLKSARTDGALWLLVIAFCVAAPVSEELFARGFLYRGWSESFLRPTGGIVLSSLVWTALHLQYNWFFFGEVFSIGLLLGYLRYRFRSTWLTIFVHGLNNLAAVVQSIWLAGHA